MSWIDYMSACLVRGAGAGARVGGSGGGGIGEGDSINDTDTNIISNDNIENLLSDLIPGLLVDASDAFTNLHIWQNLKQVGLVPKHVTTLQIKSFLRVLAQKDFSQSVKVWNRLLAILTPPSLVEEFMTEPLHLGKAYIPLLYTPHGHEMLPQYLRYELMVPILQSVFAGEGTRDGWGNLLLLAATTTELRLRFLQLLTDIVVSNRNRARAIARTAEAGDGFMFNISQALLHMVNTSVGDELPDNVLQDVLMVLYLTYPMLIDNTLVTNTSTLLMNALMMLNGTGSGAGERLRVYKHLKGLLHDDHRLYRFLNTMLSTAEGRNRLLDSDAGVSLLSTLVIYNVHEKNLVPHIHGGDFLLLLQQIVNRFRQNDSVKGNPIQLLSLFLMLNQRMSDGQANLETTVAIIESVVPVAARYKGGNTEARLYANHIYDTLYNLLKTRGEECVMTPRGTEDVLNHVIDDVDIYDYSINLLNAVLRATPDYRLGEKEMDYIVARLMRIIADEKSLLSRQRYVEKSILVKYLMHHHTELFYFHLVAKTTDPLATVMKWRSNAFMEQMIDLDSIANNLSERSESNRNNLPDDRFLDALTGELMRDPVRLPGSDQVVDRSTALIHLRLHNEDPFTRTPLQRSDLVEENKLRDEIHDFISSDMVI